MFSVLLSQNLIFLILSTNIKASGVDSVIAVRLLFNSRNIVQT